MFAALVALATVAQPTSVSINLQPPTHQVSPLLFGFNEYGTKVPVMKAAGSRIARWGGNLTSRYNWKDDVDHSANDWYFAVRNNPKPARESDKAYAKFLREAREAGLVVNLCIPIGDWIAKRPPTPDQTLGSFPLSLYPDQEKSWEGFGNGVRKDGTKIYGNDPNLANIPNSPALQGEWIATIRRTFGPASTTGPVKFVGLDNEVGLWHATHRDVMPKGIWTTDALIERNIAYAKAVKAADPSIQVLGFSGWGHLDLAGSDMDWSPPGEDGHLRRFQFTNSATERLRDQRQNRAGLSSFEHYLRKVAEAERRDGRTYIDHISVNFYGAYYGKDKDGKVVPLVEDHPYEPTLARQQFEGLRGWWDPTYVNQDTWTRHADNEAILYKPFEPFIPKVSGYIKKWKPGSGLAITEFEAGSRSHFHGALLRAALLGIYMRENVWSATAWYDVTPDKWAFWGQALLMNYDGKGGNVLGKYTPTGTIPGQNELHIHATRRDGVLHIILINTSPNRAAQIGLPNRAKPEATQFLLTQAGGKKITSQPLRVSNGLPIQVTAPAFSAQVIRIEN